MSNDSVLFYDNFKSLIARDGESEVIKKARGRAWDKLISMGLPAPLHEDFQYMSLNPIFTTLLNVDEKEASLCSVDEFVMESSKKSYLTFINGNFSQNHSCLTGFNSSIVVLPIRQAFRSYGVLITNSWNAMLKDEKDPFSLLNAACFQDGVFIYIPPKFQSEHHLQIVNLVTNADCVMPRIFLFQGSDSELTLISTICNKSEEHTFYNECIEVHLEERAKLNLIQTNPINQQNSGWLFQTLRSTVKKEANFNSVHLIDSFITSRIRAHINLTGERGEANLSGLFLLNEKKQSHAHITCVHEAPFTKSMQLFKSILRDSSQTSFQGKIVVRKEAQKTEAYQLNNNLLLNSNAKANSKPNLEISADDVKASHGATVGKLNKDQLFYLKTRGFNEIEAQNVLMSSFAQDVITRVPVSLQDAINLHMNAYKIGR